MSLDILYTGLAGDANRQYLCEQRLLPRTTSTQTASLTAAKNAISMRVLDVLTFARVKCNQKGGNGGRGYTGVKTLQFNLNTVERY